MTLVDSCGWLEYFAGTVNAANFKAAIEDPDKLIVPTICITEVFKKILKEYDESKALLCAASMSRGIVIDLKTEIGMLSARFGVEYKLPLVDSIVYATGIQHNAEIITQDADFKGLPSVRYFEKKGKSP